MKYLKLKFNNARLYRNHRGSRSKHIQTYRDDKGKEKMIKFDRKDLGNFVDPITVHQISNVLHKLFGKRPVPFFREVVYNRDEYLFEKANESYLFIRPHYINKKGNEKFARETTRITKSDFNSWKKGDHISWEKIKYFLSYDEDRFKYLKNYFKTILKEKITESKSFRYYAEKLRSIIDKVDKDFFMKYKMTPIYDFIKTDEPSGINASITGGKFGNTVNIGVHGCEVLDGEILVPVTEEDIENLRTYSKGTAKILDGGIVEIVNIVNSVRKRDLEDKFTKVSDLSTEIKYL